MATPNLPDRVAKLALDAATKEGAVFVMVPFEERLVLAAARAVLADADTHAAQLVQVICEQEARLDVWKRAARNLNMWWVIERYGYSPSVEEWAEAAVEIEAQAAAEIERARQRGDQ